MNDEVPPSIVSPLTSTAPSSNEEMSKLVDLVRQQMKMMQTITDTQLKSSKEQKCLKEEKAHMG
eukprot:1997596-Ditylum_brightwellii.AAC.1